MSDLYILYLRKSREEMDREYKTGEDVLQTHRERLTRLSKERGYAWKEFAEVVSGDTIAGRPVFSHILDAEIPSGKYRGILVNEISRLGRGDMEDAGRIYKTIIKYDLLVITPHKTYNPQNRSDLRQMRFELFLSREEFELIRERLQDGKDHRAKQGYAPNYLATLGFDSVRGKITVIPEEAALVKEIFELRAYNDKSYKEISDILNERGLTTKRGTKYYGSTIQKILKNKRYIGIAIWDGKEYPSQSPAIISIELWNMVHNEVNPNRTVRKKTTKEDSPYFVDLYCHLCKSRMYGEWITTRRLLKSGCRATYNEYGIYICVGRKSKDKCKHQQRITFIHDQVFEELKKLLNDREIIKQLQAERDKMHGTQSKDVENNIVNLKKLLSDKDKFLAKLENDYAKGDLPAVLYGKHYEETARQKDSLQAQIDDLKRKLSNKVNLEDANVIVRETKNRLQNWDGLTTPQKKQIISAFFPRIEVDKSGNLYIMRVLPVSLG